MFRPVGDFLGHPRGLTILWATETWERFSYFGNAALVVLYMVKYLLWPGPVETVLGLGTIKTVLESLVGHLEPQPLASQLFGLYTGLAYSAPILGGIIADRLLGQRRTVLIGGVLMAFGHFMMAFEAMFLIALLLLILGIGAFKPNISSQVGSLYRSDDQRRDRGYLIFYVGISVGAFLAPLVCGALAVRYGWHAGFSAAGIGMLLSLGIYLCGIRALPQDEIRRDRRRREERQRAEEEHLPSDPEGRRAALPVLGVCAAVILFWAAADQQGNTILLWAEDFTNRSIDIGFWRGEIPSPWFLSLGPLCTFVLTPLLVHLWARQGERGREPSPIRKMAFGALCLALANLVMAGAAASGTGKASALWLVGYFVLATIGELHVAPIGLAWISKTAPSRSLSTLMGIWFAATLPADIFGGFLGGFWSSMAKPNFFLLIAVIAGCGSLALRLQEAPTSHH